MCRAILQPAAVEREAPISDLSAHAGFLMRMVSSVVSKEFARKLAREDVTVAEWVMLRALYGRDALAPSMPARQMGMTKGAVSKLAERLLDKGLIARTDNPEDKRGHSLSLTPAGIAKLPDAEHEALKWLLQTLIDGHALTAAPVD
ncbi:MAG: hypothetical protein ABT10_04690 [Novosphingobium sp. SCN 63-17]|nr:MAG: hypothetical protein ABT10_04690 [Novosphingobium sp. SCN 63-17]OJX93652.1 MAG: hypothetical protein BGP00_11670 [Novosphingobium sp. 63-713]